MNILFITLGSINNLKGNGLYIDLINELEDRGNNVYVITPNERRHGEKTTLSQIRNIQILKVRTGNITKTNFIEKGISTILIEKQFIKAIKKYYNNVQFDVVLYTTPPVTFEKVIKYVKKRDNSLTYLILKDIFPQNAVDLGIIKSRLLLRYFKGKERKLYFISDYIGCTSKANVDYVLKHNPTLSPSKVELFPNSIRPRSLSSRTIGRNEIRRKFDIPLNSTVFVYGGNIGKPQGVDFIFEVLKRSVEYENIFFMVLGSGTDFKSLKSRIEEINLKNVKVINSMPENEYWDFLECCDVGLIFLDKRFTVPNTPARLTYYMEASLPILAATDIHTDIKDILNDSECGYWTESGNIEEYYFFVEKLIADKKLRRQLGKNGRFFLESNYIIKKNCDTIEKHLNKGVE